MKLNAVGVVSTDLSKTISFYKLLGFTFGELSPDEKHVESVGSAGSAKLMIDTQDVVKDIIGETPKPGNHSSFAVEYAGSSQVNEVAERIAKAGFSVSKEPWDAFWGQRYAVVEDPDGYKVDLYAQLDSK
jgi:uncharacterized glyoxalase superfamily protein PhnB